MKLDEASNHIIKEYWNVRDSFEEIKSIYEGYAFLQEALDNLWVAVKNASSRDDLRDRAVKLTAEALRLLVDCL